MSVTLSAMQASAIASIKDRFVLRLCRHGYVGGGPACDEDRACWLYAAITWAEQGLVLHD